MDRLTPIILST